MGGGDSAKDREAPGSDDPVVVSSRDDGELSDAYRRIGATPHRRFEWLMAVGTRAIASPEGVQQAMREFIAFARLGGYGGNEHLELRFAPAQEPFVSRLQQHVVDRLESFQKHGALEVPAHRLIWRP